MSRDTVSRGCAYSGTCEGSGGPAKRPVGGAGPQKDSHQDISRFLRHNSGPGTGPVLRGPRQSQDCQRPKAFLFLSPQSLWEEEEGQCGGQEPLGADRPEHYSLLTRCVTRGPPTTSLNLCVLITRCPQCRCT